MKQNFFCTLPQTCGLIQTCLTSGLVFCSDVHYQLLDLLLRRVPFQIIPIQLNLPPVTFTFMHLADAFIQSDLQCIQAIIFLSVCVLPGNRTHNLLLALLTQCSTTKPQEHFTQSLVTSISNMNTPELNFNCPI